MPHRCRRPIYDPLSKSRLTMVLRMQESNRLHGFGNVRRDVYLRCGYSFPLHHSRPRDPDSPLSQPAAAADGRPELAKAPLRTTGHILVTRQLTRSVSLKRLMIQLRERTVIRTVD